MDVWGGMGCTGTFSEICAHRFASCRREVRITIETAKSDGSAGGDWGVEYCLVNDGGIQKHKKEIM